MAAFITNRGEKGVQRPVLPPGTLVPIHPVAFVVVTSREVFGLPVSPELASLSRDGSLSPESFGLTPEQLQVVVIAPQGQTDVIGLVTTLEGAPLDKGDMKLTKDVDLPREIPPVRESDCTERVYSGG